MGNRAKTDARKFRTQERRLEAVRLRNAGHSGREVAQMMGCSRVTVRKYLIEAFAQVLPEEVAEMRASLEERLGKKERMLEELIAETRVHAKNGPTVNPISLAESYDAIKALTALDARHTDCLKTRITLYGLAAPQQVEHSLQGNEESRRIEIRVIGVDAPAQTEP
jgi:predicted transcriptional regulator